MHAQRAAGRRIASCHVHSAWRQLAAADQDEVGAIGAALDGGAGAVRTTACKGRGCQASELADDAVYGKARRAGRRRLYGRRYIAVGMRSYEDVVFKVVATKYNQF